MDRVEEFKGKLSALLKEYKADIEADDHWMGYPECGQDIRITINIDDSLEGLEFGTYIDPELLDKEDK